MSYRGRTESSILGFIFLFIIVITIPLKIKATFFNNTNDYFFWISYLISFFSLLLITFYVIPNSIKKIRDWRKKKLINNSVCKHGIKGGRTLGNCQMCLKEIQEEIVSREVFKKEEERKLRIAKNATQLKNSEIRRLAELNFVNLDLLRKLHPNQFEDLVAILFKELGYEVHQTPYSNDGGKDIILKKGNEKFLVECKRYSSSNTVDIKTMREFFGVVISEKASGGIFVTTSDFNKSAIEFSLKNKIELINHAKLISMLKEIYPEKYDSKIVRVMCLECEDIVEFDLASSIIKKECRKFHEVINTIKKEEVSDEFFSKSKICLRCGKQMKLRNHGYKKFWGCSDYPRCNYTQKYYEVKYL